MAELQLHPRSSIGTLTGGWVGGGCEEPSWEWEEGPTPWWVVCFSKLTIQSDRKRCYNQVGNQLEGAAGRFARTAIFSGACAARPSSDPLLCTAHTAPSRQHTTGWQLLADQVAAANGLASNIESDDSSDSFDDATAAAHDHGRPQHAAAPMQHLQQQQQQQQPMRMDSGTTSMSSMSEDSITAGGTHATAMTRAAGPWAGVMGGIFAAPNVATPRPHQCLYREYKLLEEIGSGGFGRVIK